MRGSQLLVAVLVLTAAVGAIAPAAAQENATATPTGNETRGEQIDRNTVLVSSSYNQSTGMVSVTLRSQTLQQVTITDAGAFMQGGEVAQRSVTLRPDSTATVEIPATEYRGFVGVSIATQRKLYAEPIRISNPWFQGESTWADVQAAGAGSSLGVLLVVGILAWRRRDGGREEVRRRA